MRTYAEVQSKKFTNTVGTNSKPKNTGKDKIMELNVCKANYGFCGKIKLKVASIVIF